MRNLITGIIYQLSLFFLFTTAAYCSYSEILSKSKNQEDYKFDQGTFIVHLSTDCMHSDCVNLKIWVFNNKGNLMGSHKVECSGQRVYDVYSDGSPYDTTEVYDRGLKSYCDGSVTVIVPSTGIYSVIIENKGADNTNYDLEAIAALMPCKGFAGEWMYTGWSYYMSIKVRGNQAEGILQGQYVEGSLSGTITGNVLNGVRKIQNPITGQMVNENIRLTLGEGAGTFTGLKEDGTENFSTPFRCGYDIKKNPGNMTVSKREISGQSVLVNKDLQDLTHFEKDSVSTSNTSQTTSKTLQSSPKIISPPVNKTQVDTSEHYVIVSPLVTTLRALKDFKKICSSSKNIQEFYQSSEKTKTEILKSQKTSLNPGIKDAVLKSYYLLHDLGYLRLYYSGLMGRNTEKMIAQANDIIDINELSDIASNAGKLKKLDEAADEEISKVDIFFNEGSEQPDKNNQTVNSSESAPQKGNEPAARTNPNTVPASRPASPKPQSFPRIRETLRKILRNPIKIN